MIWRRGDPAVAQRRDGSGEGAGVRGDPGKKRSEQKENFVVVVVVLICAWLVGFLAGMGDDGERAAEEASAAAAAAAAAGWRLNVSDFQMPERPKDPPFVTRVFLRSLGMFH
ncbi:hypothetical protein ABZP36_015859 [Zizania latifolia]